MDQTAAPTQPPVPTARTVARPRPQARARAGAGLLAAAVLMVGLSGCAVAEDGGEAASEAASSSSSQATDTSAEAGGQPVADTAVGNAARTALPSVVTISATSSSASGSGSGSILDTEGHILTNTHVVTLGGQANDAELTVRTSDGEVYAATVVGTDPLSDLAVIKIDAPDLTPIQIGRSGDLKVGDEAVAIGAPLGLPNTVTDGIISTLDRTIAVASSEAPEPQGESSGSSSGSDQYRFQLPGTPQGTRGEVYINVLQTDAAINPGNSGGALVNADGQLIGINSSIASLGGSSGSSQSGNIGIGFAIPSNVVKNISGQLIAKGKAEHALLGIGTSPTEVKSGNATLTAAKVASVAPGSGAAKAGLRKDDAITAIDGEPVTSPNALVGQVRSRTVGSAVKLTIIRDGRQQEVSVTLGAQSDVKN